MNLLSNIFKSGKKSVLKMRFSKSQDQWQVFKGMQLMYVGEKSQCEKYVENFQVAL